MNPVIARKYVEENYVHKNAIRKVIRLNDKGIRKLQKAFPNFYKITEDYQRLSLINMVLEKILEGSPWEEY